MTMITHVGRRLDAPTVDLVVDEYLMVRTDAITAQAIQYCHRRGLRFLVHIGTDNAVDWAANELTDRLEAAGGL